jgi:hypothetical protein
MIGSKKATEMARAHETAIKRYRKKRRDWSLIESVARIMA